MKKTGTLLLGIIFMVQLSAQNVLKDAKPFYISGRPEQGSIMDCSDMNVPVVSDSQRIVTGEDGHLYADGKRIRIFGTNISNLPEKSDAEYWAKTLSSQGFNCIRFHHLDSDWTNALFVRGTDNRMRFSESGLDKFDYFFYELKKNGIYTNFNLLTGRNYSSKDNLPAEIEKVSGWKQRHSFGFWDNRGLDAQKAYAEKILTHVNPYTGIKYIDDPALAIVEINNENGMYQSFLDGTVDSYPEVLKKSLHERYNKWLLKKGYTVQKLASLFNRNIPRGKEIIDDMFSWNLEQHNGAEAKVNQKYQDDSIIHSIKVQKNGTENWHVQYTAASFELRSDKVYTLKFRGRASKNTSVTASIMQNHEDWKNLGFSKKLSLTTQWTEFQFQISNLMADKKGRLTIGDMGNQAGTTFEFADFEFYEGADIILVDENADQIRFPSLDEYISMPKEFRAITAEFIISLESDYWLGFNDWLKNTLGLKALTIGTIVSCAEPGVLSQFDIVDSHAYWHHPSFHGRDWDTSDYSVLNQSLTTDTAGGTLTALASQRIFGKPFSVTEYDHPYPSNYCAEMMPMYASYAAFQDWDAIFNFCYEITQKGEAGKTKVKISGYFDQANNPVKIAACPVAARIFREGLIAPGDTLAYTTLSTADEIRILSEGANAWNIIPPERFGLSKELGLVYRTGTLMVSSDEAERKKQTEKFLQSMKDQNLNVIKASPELISQIKTSRKKGDASVSCTGQIVWSSSGYYTADSPDAFVSVTVPGVKNNSSSRSNSGIQFKPSDDFAVLCAARISKNQFAAFSGSWSGNAYDGMRIYGSKAERGIFKVFRQKEKLTTNTSFGRYAIALGADGEVTFRNRKNCVIPLSDGGKNNGNAKKQSVVKNSEGTLWYLITE